MCFLMRRGINENAHALKADYHPAFIIILDTNMLSYFKELKAPSTPLFVYEVGLRPIV